MPEDPNDPTPHGQTSYTESDWLPFRAGHPHVDELNDPTAYGLARPDYTKDPIAFKQWEKDRAQQLKDTGSPILPNPDPQ